MPGNHQNPRLFGPFVAKILKVEGDDGFDFDSVSYNEKHNLIIASPMDKSLQFFDATTLLPFEEFETQVLDHAVLKMPFCPETETFIFGCDNGDIYVYNLPKKSLQKLEQPVHSSFYVVVFINSSYYAFSTFQSHQIEIRNFENGNLFHTFLEKSDIYDLESLPKRNLLFSRLADGSVMMYRTDCLPKLPLLYSIQGDRSGWRRMQSITINGKDFILSKRKDAFEIWDLTLGKMRRLKVVRIPEGVEEVYSMVYLENYKMIATTHVTHEIRFWGLLSGKLECTLDVGMEDCFHSFLMKDKNALGVVGIRQNTIKIVQLHSPQE